MKIANKKYTHPTTSVNPTNKIKLKAKAKNKYKIYKEDKN